MKDPARQPPFNLLPRCQDADAGFVWGRHHKAYLQYCVRRCPLTFDELMARCGYKKRQKFESRREDWNRGVGKIPLAYLQVLEVDMDLLETAVELDRREIEEAAERAGPPKTFIVRYMAAVCKTHELPEGTSEEEAIELVKQFSVERGFKCMIDTPGLKTILFSPDGSVYTGYCYPEVRLENGMLSFGSDGSQAGTAGVGR